MKALISILIVILALVTAYLSYPIINSTDIAEQQPSEANKTQKKNIESQAKAQTQQAPTELKNKSIEDNANAELVEYRNTYGHVVDDITADYYDWIRKHGYTERFQKDSIEIDHEEHPYNVYDDETLASMTENDKLAALLLGRRMLHNKQFNVAKPYLLEAAVDGYASALRDLSTLYRELTINIHENGNVSEADNLLIEALAWHLVFDHRFNVGISTNIQRKRQEKSILGILGNTVSEETIQRIISESTIVGIELYEELKSMRTTAGYGEFDNSVPKIFKAFIEIDEN